MRESIGGLWLFSIVVTFIVLFVSFLAYSISYTRAFKVKNEIINYIERAEGFTKSDRNIRSITYEELSAMDNPTVDIQAYVQIQNIGYNYSIADQVDCSQYGYGHNQVGGYCLKRFCPNNENGAKIYYKVTTFIAFKIPILNFIFKIPITGETKALYYDQTSAIECDEMRYGYKTKEVIKNECNGC